MTEHFAIRDRRRAPTHPGALLKEIIEDHHLGVAVVAKAIGVSRQHIYDIINERKPVSAAVAVRLGKLMGNGAGLWCRMQLARDLWEAEQKIDTSTIETIHLEDS